MDYKTVKGAARSEFVVDRSRFVSFAAPAETMEEGVRFAKQLKKQFADATHVVYGVNAPDGEKCSDDGEPKGTAGQPVLSVLKKKNLIAAVAVARWFGGVKLGAGGLIDAYTKAAADAIGAAETVEKRRSAVIEARADYRLADAVKSVAQTYKILSERYEEAVTFTLAVPVAESERLIQDLIEATAGKARIEITSYQYETY